MTYLHIELLLTQPQALVVRLYLMISHRRMATSLAMPPATSGPPMRSFKRSRNVVHQHILSGSGPLSAYSRLGYGAQE